MKMLPPLVLAVCFAAGILIGYLNGYLASGALLGAGAGFILLSILRMVFRSREKKPDKETSTEEHS